jgi:hypothetical protein
VNTLFPFGFPWPTAFYMTLFVLTAAIYMIFMQYVTAAAIALLAGPVAWWLKGRVVPRPVGEAHSGWRLIEAILRDWLPAVLGVAITAGVAPLLFLQILYKHEFYTANLLLLHRFMLLLPALIVAYYMLYLQKRQALAARGAPVRLLIALVAFACFFYTGLAWIENHILSLHRNLWRGVYTSGRWFYRDMEIWPRVGFWITSSFATLSLALAWQLRWGRRYHNASDLDLAVDRSRAVALLGLATSAAECWLWHLWLEPDVRQVVSSGMALPYGVMALVGMAVQAGGWLPLRSGARLTVPRLALISAGAVLANVGTLVVREARRLATIDVTALYEAHARAARVSGLALFLTFFAINAAVITVCVLIVKRALRPAR